MAIIGLKVCPKCETVCSDGDMVCGVCGCDIGEVSPEADADAVRGSEATERASELRTAQLDRLEFIKRKKRLLASALVRLTIGPVFAVGGFLALLDLSSGPSPALALALIIMLTGFANIFWEFQRSGPPYGYAKVWWILVKAQRLTEIEEDDESEASR